VASPPARLEAIGEAMQSLDQTPERTKRGRIAAVDVARALALLGMAAYHLTWDLAHFGFIGPSVPFTPVMRLVSHTVASAFLALVGVSFALAHSKGLRREAFLRRVTVVACAAFLVTLATEFLAPEEPITFGILHCIAAASLLAAIFVAAPIWMGFAAGALAIAAPLVVSFDRFNGPALAWLGLGTVAPPTLDWRPLLPWSGVVLVALSLARAVLPRVADAPWARWRPHTIAGRAMAFAGRHSLAIYLVHQPILFAALFALANVTGVAARHERTSYIAACRPACVENGGDLDLCEKACACVADRAQAAGLPLVSTAGKGDETRQRLRAVVDSCSSQAR
jgi:uncharacterized membrane protein